MINSIMIKRNVPNIYLERLIVIIQVLIRFIAEWVIRHSVGHLHYYSVLIGDHLKAYVLSRKIRGEFLTMRRNLKQRLVLLQERIHYTAGMNTFIEML